MHIKFDHIFGLSTLYISTHYWESNKVTPRSMQFFIGNLMQLAKILNSKGDSYVLLCE